MNSFEENPSIFERTEDETWDYEENDPDKAFEELLYNDRYESDGDIEEDDIPEIPEDME